MLEMMKELIRSQEICVLATASRDRPHCSLMAYATDDACREIYMVTHRNTTKLRNALQNPWVSLLVDSRLQDYGEDRQRTRALSIDGLFERVEDPERRETLRARFLERHPHLREFASHQQAEVCIVRIRSLQLLDGIKNAYHETIS